MENKYNIVINGISYDILSERSEDFIKEIESYVNEKMSSIVSANPKVSVSTAAVFTALNAAEDLIKEREAGDIIRGQVAEYSKEAYDAKQKAVEYRNKYNEAIEEIERLKRHER